MDADVLEAGHVPLNAGSLWVPPNVVDNPQAPLSAVDSLQAPLNVSNLQTLGQNVVDNPQVPLNGDNPLALLNNNP